MFNIGICCSDIKEMNVVNTCLNKFFSVNNFNYKLYKFNSMESLLYNLSLDFHIILVSIDLKNKSLIYDFQSKCTIYNKDIKIIFIPEIVDFMTNGFFLKDFRYILSPINYLSFDDELSLCLQELNSNKLSYKNFNCITDKKNYTTLDNIDYDTILFVEANKKSSIIHTTIDTINYNCQLNHLYKKLNDSRFFMCHKNYIVNLEKITKFNRSYVMTNSNTIPVSTNKFKELKNNLLIMLNLI